jgi:hypothetical protein
MVVVPTSDHVSMHFGMTTIDWSGWLITILGLAGIVLLWRAGPIAMPDAKPWRRPRPDPVDGVESEVADESESDTDAISNTDLGNGDIDDVSLPSDSV